MQVLVLWAEPDLARNLRDILALDGFDFVAAADGREAAGRLGEVPVDVLLLAGPPDWPGEGALRALASRARVPVLSAYPDLLAAIRSLRRLAADHPDLMLDFPPVPVAPTTDLGPLQESFS